MLQSLKEEIINPSESSEPSSTSTSTATATASTPSPSEVQATSSSSVPSATSTPADEHTPFDTTTPTGNNSSSPTTSPTSTSSTSRFFQTGFSKTKSIFANTTSSLKSVSQSVSEKVSEKAPSILASTTTSINNTVKKTSAQIQELNKSVQVNEFVSNVTKAASSTAATTASNVQSVIPDSVSAVSSSVSAGVSSSISNISSTVQSAVTESIPSVVQEVEQTANSTMNSLSSILPNNPLTRKYTVPDKAVASQVLMYRQILHTECKPGLRLSRGYEGTDAQRKVKHMPWWEQGVESTKKMVISYNNLIVRLWLNGAIMPFVDGGYASDHVGVSVPKDDEDLGVVVKNERCENNNEKENDDSNGSESHDEKKDELNDHDESTINTEKDENETNNDTNEENSNNNNDSSSSSHINTLIDSNGLPPIPHPYWVDRLGFQQTDPVTDFRSGGVLSLAMLVHIVETCPNVHARFLPSGDAHMLPFGITCINITDMLAKFCMFSKAVDRMDALLSQKPFWRMFADPNSLLVLQELSMEVLCNVVVEMGRERKMPKIPEEEEGNSKKESFSGQDGTDKVTVFDFAEILARTEKRVHDDLLGSGPKTVDDLRAIHTRNFTKYMKALEWKEYRAKKNYDRYMQRKNGDNDAEDDNLSQSQKATMAATMAMTENVIGTAGGVLNKFKQFGFRSNTTTDTTNDEKGSDGTGTKTKEITTEEINFAMPKSSSSTTAATTDTTKKQNDLFDMSDAPAPPVFDDTTTNDISVEELFDFDDTAVAADAAPSSNFTIDDDDFL